MIGIDSVGNLSSQAFRKRFTRGISVAAALAFALVGSLFPLTAQTLDDYATPYTITTYAGNVGQAGNTDGTASAATFAYPNGVALDGSGNVYVADSGSDKIRKITPAGVVTTLAGTGTSGHGDGTGSSATFGSPTGVAVDRFGDVFVADNGNAIIRKITPGGVVSTYAGLAGAQGSSDGSAASARFNTPFGVAVDGSGNLYVADTNNCNIRKISASGLVTTLAGASPGQNSEADGSGAAAKFAEPTGVAVDGSGNVYAVDYAGQTIRKITPTGTVTTYAGGNTVQYDGAGSQAGFYLPMGVAVDGSGNVYVADTQNCTIRKITPGGIVTTLAGMRSNYSSANGTGDAAGFYKPFGVTASGDGSTIYVADTSNFTIRKGILTPDAFGGKVAGVNLNSSTWFGYYTTVSYPFIYEYNLGYEYVFPSGAGVYLYDYTSGHYFYTQSSYFPFVYDFTLNAYLYYYQANTPNRHFYDFGTNQVISE